MRELYALRERVAAVEAGKDTTSSAASDDRAAEIAASKELADKVRTLEGSLARISKQFEESLNRQTRISEVSMQTFVGKAVEGLKAEILAVLADFHKPEA